MPPGRERSAWLITLAAAAILMVTMGARQSLGLFISPLRGSTGLGITTISLAFAIAQLMWGVIQPVSALWPIAMVQRRSLSQAWSCWPSHGIDAVS